MNVWLFREFGVLVPNHLALNDIWKLFNLNFQSISYRIESRVSTMVHTYTEAGTRLILNLKLEA